MDPMQAPKNVQDVTVGRGMPMPVKQPGNQVRPPGPPPGSPRYPINNGSIGGPRLSGQPPPNLQNFDSRPSLGSPTGPRPVFGPARLQTAPGTPPNNFPRPVRYPGAGPGLRGPYPGSGPRPPFNPTQLRPQRPATLDPGQPPIRFAPVAHGPDGRVLPPRVIPETIVTGPQGRELIRPQRMETNKNLEAPAAEIQPNTPKRRPISRNGDNEDDDDDDDVIIDSEKECKSPDNALDDHDSGVPSGKTSSSPPLSKNPTPIPADDPKERPKSRISESNSPAPYSRPISAALADSESSELEEMKEDQPLEETEDNSAGEKSRPVSVKSARSPDLLSASPGARSPVPSPGSAVLGFDNGKLRSLTPKSPSPDPRKSPKSPELVDAETKQAPTPESLSPVPPKNSQSPQVETAGSPALSPLPPKSPITEKSSTPSPSPSPVPPKSPIAPEERKSSTPAPSPIPPKSPKAEAEAKSSTPSPVPQSPKVEAEEKTLTPSPVPPKSPKVEAEEKSLTPSPVPPKSPKVEAEEKSLTPSPAPPKSPQAEEKSLTPSPVPPKSPKVEAEGKSLTPSPAPPKSPQAEGKSTPSPIPPVSPGTPKSARSLVTESSSPVRPRSAMSPGTPKAEAEAKRTTFADDVEDVDDNHEAKIKSRPGTPAIVEKPDPPSPGAFMKRSTSGRSLKSEAGSDSGQSGQTSTVKTNGVAVSPTKKSPGLSKEPEKSKPAGSPVKSPSKSVKSLPRTPDAGPPSMIDKKKVPMNKVQVGAAPSPNLKTVRSKIGSLENTSYKPGGGKVKIENRKLDFSKAQPKIAAKNEKYAPSGGDKKITQVKLQWNAKPKVGSLDNATYKPGGGDKKIETVKLDFKDKAKPKVGSKDNAKHVPGGGTVKTPPKTPQDTNDIETQKIEIKAESKVGSLDNVKHRPGGGDKKIFDDKDYLRQTGSNVESVNGSNGQSPVPPNTMNEGKNGLPTSDENLNQEC